MPARSDAQGAPAPAIREVSVVNLSIRNRLPGTVTRLTAGQAMTGVTVDVGGGHLTAVITNAAVTDLGLAPGTDVTALVKATELSLATPG